MNDEEEEERHLFFRRWIKWHYTHEKWTTSFVCCYCFSVDDWVANVIFKVQKQEYKQILYFKCFPVYIFLFIFSRKYVYNMSYLKRNRSYRWDELWARLSWKDAAKNEKEEVIKLIEGKVLKRTQEKFSSYLFFL